MSAAQYSGFDRVHRTAAGIVQGATAGAAVARGAVKRAVDVYQHAIRTVAVLAKHPSAKCMEHQIRTGIRVDREHSPTTNTVTAGSSAKGRCAIEFFAHPQQTCFRKRAITRSTAERVDNIQD